MSTTVNRTPNCALLACGDIRVILAVGRLSLVRGFLRWLARRRIMVHQAGCGCSGWGPTVNSDLDAIDGRHPTTPHRAAVGGGTLLCTVTSMLCDATHRWHLVPNDASYIGNGSDDPENGPSIH